MTSLDTQKPVSQRDKTNENTTDKPERKVAPVRSEVVNLPSARADASNQSVQGEKVGREDAVYGNNAVKSSPIQSQATPQKSRSAMQKMGRFLVKFFLVILQAGLMIAVLAGSYFVTKRMLAEKPEPRKRPAFKTVYTVETVTAEAKDRRPTIISYGQTVAARSVDLRSLVPGEVIKVSPSLRAGARVSSGDALVEIDDFDYRGALQEAEANLAEARARILENEAQIKLEESRLKAAREQLTLAQTDLQRAESLRQRGTGTQKALDDRRLIVSQREQAIALAQDTISVQQSRKGQIEASVQRLEWRVEQAKRNLQSTTLVAPFDGIVRSSAAEVGRNITASDVAVSLYEADTLEVRFTLTDSQYGRLQNSNEGLVDRTVDVKWTVGGESNTYKARIDRLGAEITSNRGGVELFAKLENPTSDKTGIPIRPGAFVEVIVPDRLYTNTVLVPDTAIYGTGTAYVAVDGRLQERKVDVVGFEGEQALVASGLQGGDEVLITRITEVSEGLLVRREGDAVAQPQQSSGAQGRPSREEIQAILKANNLTLDQWRALEQPERRTLIAAHRQTGS